MRTKSFQVEVTVLYTLISEVAFHYLCLVHLIKSMSLGAAHTPAKEVIPGVIPGSLQTSCAGASTLQLVWFATV